MKTMLLIFGCIFSLNLWGQNEYTIQGKTLDNENEPLIGATIVILNPTDSTMVAFNITDNDGAFQIKNIKRGAYTLQITYIGFGTFEKPLQIEGEDSKINLGDIVLSSDLNKLDEVVVEAEFIPLVIKKDTVEYNADAYRVRPNANVEELLKQMPGIEIESDGTISAQGEEVKSVTVDGKKFFGDDPKMATKNIPADAVKKVQVFDQKSDKAEFSGVNDGNETKTINLELKDDKKVGLFGNLEGGYGTDGRYKTKASINKFGAKYQLAGIVSYNNINDQGFSFSEYQTLVGSSSFGRGNGFKINGPVNFDGLANGNTTSFSGGLNASLTPNKKLEITTSYFLTHVDKISINEVSKEFTLTEDNFFENSFSNEKSQSLGHNLNFELEYKPDSIQRIDLDFSYKNNIYDNFYTGSLSTTDNLNQLINGSEQDYDTEADNDNFQGQIEYNRRLGKIGRILTLEGELGNVLDRDSSIIEQNNLTYTDSEILTDLIIQDQISRQDDKSYQVKVNYKEPVAKDHYVDFFFERKNYNSEKVKDFFDYDQNNLSTREYNQELSRLTNNDINYNRAGMEYSIDKEKYSFNVKGMYNSSEINGSVIGENDINNKYHYFLPSVRFNFNEPNIRLRYNTSVNEPSINQLQSIVDNTNPTQIYVGNPNLKPEYKHEVSARYFFFNRFNLNNLFTYFSYAYTKDKIVNAQSLDENKRRISQPTNVDNNHRFSTSISYSTPIRPLKLKTSLRVGGSYNKGLNIINEIENEVTTLQPYIRYSIENTNNKVVSLRLGSSINYNENKFSQSTEQNTNYLNHDYEANLSITLPKSWYFDTDYTIQFFSQEEFSDGYNYQLLNTSISKGFKKDRILVKLSAFDLLNQNLGFSRAIENTYIQQSVTNSIQRYFMLSVVYKLTEFGPSNDKIRIRRH